MAGLMATKFKLLDRLAFWRKKGTVVPALRLSGVIGSMPLRGGGLTLSSLERQIEALFAPKDAPAAVLLLNSPGGSPVQSSLIAQRIRALAEEKKRPVYAFVEDVAASGGYWLACAADEIYRDPGLDRRLDRRGERRLRLPERARPARRRATGPHHRRPQGAARPVPSRAPRGPGAAARDPGRHPRRFIAGCGAGAARG